MRMSITGRNACVSHAHDGVLERKRERVLVLVTVSEHQSNYDKKGRHHRMQAKTAAKGLFAKCLSSCCVVFTGHGNKRGEKERGRVVMFAFTYVYSLLLCFHHLQMHQRGLWRLGFE